MSEIIHFDRKTFDPVNNKQHKNRLAAFRRRGGSRWHYQGWEMWSGERGENRWRKKLGAAYRAIPIGAKGKKLIDAGCGDSGDADDWVELGGAAVGYDLFPRKEINDFPDFTRFSCGWKPYTHHRKSKFHIQDICERWPDEDSSVDVILCQAVLSLVSPEDRKLFYRECARVLKKDQNSLLVLSFVYLKDQHDWNEISEIESAKECGLEMVKNKEVYYAWSIKSES